MIKVGKYVVIDEIIKEMMKSSPFPKIINDMKKNVELKYFDKEWINTM